MTNTLTISRDQLERWLVELKSSTAYATRKELQSILAAPAVERQEPIYQVQYLGDGGGGWTDAEKDSYDAKVPHPKHWRTRIIFTSPPAPVAVTIPEECPHLIVFDDTERENLMFSGAGARSAALKTWEKISMSWNAHLFVRVERNSRDDRYPSATSAPVAVVLPDPQDEGGGQSDADYNSACGWNACLDKVKEMNR